MPLPWTKNRVTRISEIAADLKSPKRCGSLVLETGFPTSLIDLFVKNRSHFRKPKPKSNKPVHRETGFPTFDPPPETPSSSGCAGSGRDEAPSLTQLVTATLRGNDGVAGSGHGVRSGGGSGSKTVLIAFLGMLGVVVLIASLEKVTVGITVSAFALLFFEHLCSNANGEMNEFFTRGVWSCCFWFQKLQLGMKKDCEGPEPKIVEGDTDNVVLSDLVVGVESFEEIEVVETGSEVGVCSEETCCVGGDNKCGFYEMQEDSNGKVVDSRETKGSRSVKFKSKMKKLLPKKFRGSRKEGKASSEGSGTDKKDKSPSFEIEEEQKEEMVMDSGSRSPLLLKIKLECIKENEVDHAVTVSQDVTMNSEDRRINRVGNSGYMILFVIVLVGLVVGRFPALILTMTWCFMLKIVTSRGRSLAPLIKCSVPKSWNRTLEWMVFRE